MPSFSGMNSTSILGRRPYFSLSVLGIVTWPRSPIFILIISSSHIVFFILPQNGIYYNGNFSYGFGDIYPPQIEIHTLWLSFYLVLGKTSGGLLVLPVAMIAAGCPFIITVHALAEPGIDRPDDLRGIGVFA
jgi:hypothetical protein